MIPNAYVNQLMNSVLKRFVNGKIICRFVVRTPVMNRFVLKKEQKMTEVFPSAVSLSRVDLCFFKQSQWRIVINSNCMLKFDNTKGNNALNQSLSKQYLNNCSEAVP